MKMRLPESLKGVHFDKLSTFTMNDFNSEMLLPALFYIIAAEGFGLGKEPSNASPSYHIGKFAQHPRLSGLHPTERERLLGKWVRTSLAAIGRVGMGRQRGEQILFLRPLSFLTFKPGFPAQRRRLRRVHEFVYQLLKWRFSDGSSNGRPVSELEAQIRQAFTRGVQLLRGGREGAGAPAYGGHYDGRTPLDTEVLLCLYFLDGFDDASRSINEVAKERRPPTCETAGAIFADDLASFVRAYGGGRPAVPTGVLARYLVCLANFELLIYTLKLVTATNQLVALAQLPREMGPLAEASDETGLSFYVDCTGAAGSPSGRLAQGAVGRHLEELEHFLYSVLTLRVLDRYAGADPALKDEGPSLTMGQYLRRLLDLRQNETVQIGCFNRLDDLESDNGADDEVKQFLAKLRADNTLSHLDRLVYALAEANRAEALSNYVKWFRDVGGMQRDDGLLHGRLRGERRLWRYRMGDSLLEMLVQLYFAHAADRQRRGVGASAQSAPTITELLNWLRCRYGVLIDEPPAYADAAETRMAASDNIAALRTRLRQMGLFADLSDDFNAQQLQPRYPVTQD